MLFPHLVFFFLVFYAVSLVQICFQVRIAFRIILLSRGGYGLRLTAKLGFYSVFKLFLTKLEERKCLFEKKISYYQDFYWIFACLQKLLSSYSSAFRISLFFFASTSTLLTLLASFKKSFHNKNNLYFRKGGGAHFYVLLVTFIRFVYFLFCSFFYLSCLAFFVGVILLC